MSIFNLAAMLYINLYTTQKDATDDHRLTMNHYTLVIDQGGQSTRVMVFSDRGLALASASAPLTSASLDHNNFVEFDPETILHACKALIQQLASSLPPSILEKITAAAVIAQRSSMLACDTEGKPLGRMISWQDTRNAQWLEQQQWDIDALQQQIGLRPNAHMGASKIRYLLDNDSSIQLALAKKNLVFIPWGAWLLQQLSNQPFRNQCDPILASRMGLVDLGDHDWSTDLLARYSIPRYCLPHIVPSIHNYGSVQFGDRAVPLSLLGGDQNFIAYAYGKAHTQDSLFINLGTGGFIHSLIADTDTSTLDSFYSLLCSPIAVNTHSDLVNEEHYELLLEGTVNTAANSIEWWQTQLPTPYSYQDLDTILASNEFDIDGIPIFINTLWGSGSPYWINEAHCEFIGPKTHYSRKEKTRAVLESILFACKINIDLLQQVGVYKCQGIISGGLSNSAILCQTLSNLIGIPLYRDSDQEASARGVALYLNNKTHSATAPELISIHDYETFIPKQDENLQGQLKRYEIFKHKMETLSQI